VAAAKRLASRLCWAAEGRARIRAGCCCVAALAVGGGGGVAPDTPTRGGGVVIVLLPTSPLSTATSTPTPIRPVEPASSHARRSEAGAGRCANSGEAGAGALGRSSGNAGGACSGWVTGRYNRTVAAVPLNHQLACSPR